MGERHVRAARRLPGDGRRRQGQRDRARDVGRQPAGRAGRLVQDAVRRGARPRLPLAHRRRRCRSGAGSASSTARTTRRSSRSACTPSGSTSSGCPTGDAWARTSGSERYEDINAFERHLDRNGTKIVKFFLNVSQGGAEAALPRAARHARQGLEVQRGRRHRARPLGRLHGGLRGTRSPRPRRAWAPWYVIPADHKWLTQALVARDPRRHDPRPRPAVARGVGVGAPGQRRGAPTTRSGSFEPLRSPNHELSAARAGKRPCGHQSEITQLG